MSSPNYRVPAGKAPTKTTPKLDEVELDAAAFSKRLRKRSKVEDEALLERIATTARQLRLRGAFTLALGTGLLVLAAPQASEHFVSRATANGLILGSALAGFGFFVVTAGNPGAESMKDLPRWYVAGQIGFALVGGAIGVVLATFL